MIRILHRDERLAAIDKPADVSLLADRSGAPCLWDELPDVLGSKPYLVHRLDKPTSGVLLIALQAGEQRRLTRAFRERRVGKFYVAWVLGNAPQSGTIDLPLRPGRKSRYRVAGPRSSIRESGGRWSLAEGGDDGLPSITRFRTLVAGRAASLLLLAPRTGRTHQLRVHLAWIGHPILGDRIYGKPGDPAQHAERLQLHAHRLVVRGEGSFKAPIPTSGWRRDDA